MESQHISLLPRKFLLGIITAVALMVMGLTLFGCQSGPSGSGTSDKSPVEATSTNEGDESITTEVSLPAKINLTNHGNTMATAAYTFTASGLTESGSVTFYNEDGSTTTSTTTCLYHDDEATNLSIENNGQVVFDSPMTSTFEEEGTGFIWKRVADQNTVGEPANQDEKGLQLQSIDYQYTFHKNSPITSSVITTGYSYDGELYTNVVATDLNDEGLLMSITAAVNTNSGQEYDNWGVTVSYETSNGSKIMTINGSDGNTASYEMAYDDKGRLSKLTEVDGDTEVTFEYTTVETDSAAAVSFSMSAPTLLFSNFLRR